MYAYPGRLQTASVERELSPPPVDLRGAPLTIPRRKVLLAALAFLLGLVLWFPSFALQLVSAVWADALHRRLHWTEFDLLFGARVDCSLLDAPLAFWGWVAIQAVYFVLLGTGVRSLWKRMRAREVAVCSLSIAILSLLMFVMTEEEAGDWVIVCFVVNPGVTYLLGLETPLAGWVYRGSRCLARSLLLLAREAGEGLRTGIYAAALVLFLAWPTIPGSDRGFPPPRGRDFAVLFVQVGYPDDPKEVAGLADCYTSCLALGVDPRDIYVLYAEGGIVCHNEVILQQAEVVEENALTDSTYAHEATLENLRSVLERIRDQAQEGDRLLLCITTHGERTQTGSVLVLGDDSFLTTEELRSLLLGMPTETFLVLLSCYSGGFADAFRGTDVMVAASSSADQLSWYRGRDSFQRLFLRLLKRLDREHFALAFRQLKRGKGRGPDSRCARWRLFSRESEPVCSWEDAQEANPEPTPPASRRGSPRPLFAGRCWRVSAVL
jgi:hypothetical protein